MKTLFFDEFESPIGVIKVVVSMHGVERVIIAAAQDMRCEECLSSARRDKQACSEAINQLQEYFTGQRTAFTVPLCPSVPSFYARVREYVQTIAYGKTISYSEIAAAMENPRACRAVGAACRYNPIPLFIPCHRVVGLHENGGGYLGPHKEIKRSLLALEAKHSCDLDNIVE